MPFFSADVRFHLSFSPCGQVGIAINSKDTKRKRRRRRWKYGTKEVGFNAGMLKEDRSEEYTV